MTTYYLIVGNEIRSEITRSLGDVTALPVLPEAQAVSLINQAHAISLLNKIKATVKPSAKMADVVDWLGLVDMRDEL